jgi:hypothetical protein
MNHKFLASAGEDGTCDSASGRGGLKYTDTLDVFLFHFFFLFFFQICMSYLPVSRFDKDFLLASSLTTPILSHLPLFFFDDDDDCFEPPKQKASWCFATTRRGAGWCGSQTQKWAPSPRAHFSMAFTSPRAPPKVVLDFFVCHCVSVFFICVFVFGLLSNERKMEAWRN